MRLNFVILVSLGLVAQTSYATEGQTSCKEKLSFPSRAAVEAVMRRNLRSVRVGLEERPGPPNGFYFRAQEDEVVHNLWLLESPDGSQPEHEMRMARDFALNLAASGDHRFLFVPKYEGHSIPSFDGAELDFEGRTVGNVSLKSSSGQTTAEKPVQDHFLEKPRKRLFRQIKDEGLTLEKWYRLTTGVLEVKEDRFVRAATPARIERAVRLASLFGVGRFGTDDRPGLQLVLDLRDSPYDYSFVNQDRIRAGVQGVVNETLTGKDVLTLQWGPGQSVKYGVELREKFGVERHFNFLPKLIHQHHPHGLQSLQAFHRLKKEKLATSSFAQSDRPKPFASTSKIYTWNALRVIKPMASKSF